MRLRLPLAASAVAALAALAGAARAAPAPDCNGQAYKDGKGDSALTTGQDAPQLDVLQGFVTVQGETATYHLQIADLSTDPIPPYTTLNWYLMWNAEDEERYVDASYSPETGVTYGYGVRDAVGFLGDSSVEVSGSMTEGPDGFISIILPAEKVKVGDALATLHADTRAGIGTNTTGGLVSQADEAAGKTVRLQACSGVTPPPTGTVTPPPTTGAGAGAGTATPVRFSLVGKAGKASTAAKKKKLVLRIRSTGPVTGLRAKLVKGSKSVGTGKLAKIDGTARLTLKLKGKIKKGRYKLNLSGKDAQGRKAGATLPVRLS